MVDEIERLPDRAAHSTRDAAALQKKVKVGLVAERQLDEGSVAPWDVAQLRKLAAEGRKAQQDLRQHGHEPSLPEDAPPPD